MPPCNQIASAALLNTCASLEGDAGQIIEQVKTVYAARLAICELLDAGIDIPPECSTFVPESNDLREQELRGFFHSGTISKPTLHYPQYEHSTSKHLNRCAQALHQTPQFWTSFSNSKQNALVMCHAMRAPIDKGLFILD